MITNKAFYLIIAVLIVALLLSLGISRRHTPRVIATNLENIPLSIGEYRGTNDSFSSAVYAELNADKHVYRHYQTSAGKRVDLYIGYYGTAKGGRTGHNPYACLPSSGWGLVDDQEVILTSTDNMQKPYWEDKAINQLIARKSDEFTVMYHWYQSGGSHVLSNGIQQNIDRFFRRLLHNKNDGAYVQITVLTDEQHVEQAKKTGIEFVKRILDLLPDYWPVEQF